MTRSWIVVGAFVLPLVAPAVVLGAPTPVAVPAHHAETATRGADRGAEQDTFKAPEINLNSRSTEPNWQTLYPAYHLRQSNPNYVLYQPSPWNQPGCFANNPFPAAAAGQSSVPESTQIGSLVDDRSKNLFSSTPSHNPGLAYSSDAAAQSNTTGLQYQFNESRCTPFNSLNF